MTPLEFCRECRDEDEITPAVVIIWGKLFPPEALGPKCYEHAIKYLPGYSPAWISWAVFDLRGLVRSEHEGTVGPLALTEVPGRKP